LRGWAENNGYEISHADMYFDKNSEGTGNKKVCASRLNLRDRGMIEPEKYGINVNPIILSIYDKAHIMLTVQKRLREADGFGTYMKGFAGK